MSVYGITWLRHKAPSPLVLGFYGYNLLGPGVGEGVTVEVVLGTECEIVSTL